MKLPRAFDGSTNVVGADALATNQLGTLQVLGANYTQTADINFNYPLGSVITTDNAARTFTNE